MSAQIFYLILIGLYKIYVNHFNKLKTFQQPLKLQSTLKLSRRAFSYTIPLKMKKKKIRKFLMLPTTGNPSDEHMTTNRMWDKVLQDTISYDMSSRLQKKNFYLLPLLKFKKKKISFKSYTIYIQRKCLH